MRGNKHLVFGVCVAFVLFSAFASVASAGTIYVPDDYEKIQWAVDNASDGDTIIVRDGIYVENIDITKSLTIKSENGPANCIVNGTGSNVFTLKVDGIRIEGFTITGGKYGIHLRDSNNNTIINNIISSNNDLGMHIWDSNNNTIINNIISSAIVLGDSNNNSILNNNISSNNGNGIALCGSNNNIISNNNICSNKWDGIQLGDSNNNSISDNIISSNKWNGIRLSFSNENTIKNNEFVNDGLYVLCSYGNIVKDNKVNGKPLFYLEEESDKIVHKAGQVILVRCKNITIMNSELTNTDIGIELFESDECLISNNSISNNLFGIYLEGNNNSISNNLISNNGWGIYLERSNNIVSNNNISSNGCGIELPGSKNIISDNIISSNKRYGIYIPLSNENTIRNNEFINDGLFVSYSGNIVEYNKVNGKPLVYLENESDKIIYDAGQIILVKCKNITVMNAEIKNTDVGIELFESDECLISNNSISNNLFGIYLCGSNNIISNNNICSNNYGIYLIAGSNSNIIYLNNFINNTNNTYYSFYSTNIWNSTSKITYTYRGSEFTNYMGNYWDDYNGSDANGDGIGETPYSINTDKDNYPLIERFEHYFVPTPAQIFDTERPDNPYPSISGKFMGTIKTNTKIIATKLYTYPCEGTGGHTEHALICNETWCAEASWSGYEGDWMNIPFNRTVVLIPYETYNITIVTGSYPQIHHTSSLKTENGWINCTEFTDANGNKYENWIPAIKLWS